MDALRKLADIKTFGDGWGSHGDGKPFLRSVIYAAETVIRALEAEKIDTDIFPGPAGQLMVTAYPVGGAYIEITIRKGNA